MQNHLYFGHPLSAFSEIEYFQVANLRLNVIVQHKHWTPMVLELLEMLCDFEKFAHVVLCGMCTVVVVLVSAPKNKYTAINLSGTQ